MWDNELKLKQEAAKILAKEYVPIVQSAIADWTNVYLPTGNRELLEASAIFYGIANQVDLHMKKDLSKYMIKTMAGGTFIATLDIPYTITDPDYQPSFVHSTYWSCGSMTRGSLKYPSVHSWSVDSRLCSRQGNWKNNHTCDYEYLYEFITGNLPNIPANAEKYNRLKEREFISADQQVNLVILKGNHNDFYRSIPSLPSSITKRFADMALEIATMNAKYYPSQMQDLVVTRNFNNFIGNEVAIMVLDILYEEGLFKKLTDREKITSQLLMFSDTLPQ